MVRIGYKQTEVGPIPEDWNVDSIQSVLSITTGGKNTQDHVDDGAYPFFVRSQDVERIDTYSFDGEAILTAGDGVGTGRIFHYIDGKFDFHQRVYKMSDFSNRLDGFFFYVYFSNNFYSRIMSMTAKSSVDSVRREMIADMRIPLPPLQEQRSIAATLRDVDGLLNALNALIVKKRGIKQAAMQQLLTGETRLAGFNGDWVARQFGEIVKIRNEKINTFGSQYAEFCVELEQVQQNTGQIDDFSDARDRTSSKYCFRKNDVLFGRLRPYLRKFWMADRSGVCSTEIWPLIPINDGIVPSYLFQVVQTDAYIEAASTAYGTHMPRADWNVLEKHRLFFPTQIAEQEAIGAVLSDMDSEIGALEARREKTAGLKQGMMQELLTGRIRLV